MHLCVDLTTNILNNPVIIDTNLCFALGSNYLRGKHCHEHQQRHNANNTNSETMYSQQPLNAIEQCT